MHQKRNERVVDLNPQETAEWVESLDQVIDQAGPDCATFLLEHLNDRPRASGAEVPVHFNTPYVNTIRPEEEAAYPGDRAMERRIKSLIRWNAMAMVVRQNKYDAGARASLLSSLPPQPRPAPPRPPPFPPAPPPPPASPGPPFREARLSEE